MRDKEAKKVASILVKLVIGAVSAALAMILWNLTLPRLFDLPGLSYFDTVMLMLVYAQISVLPRIASWNFEER